MLHGCIRNPIFSSTKGTIHHLTLSHTALKHVPIFYRGMKYVLIQLLTEWSRLLMPALNLKTINLLYFDWIEVMGHDSCLQQALFSQLLLFSEVTFTFPLAILLFSHFLSTKHFLYLSILKSCLVQIWISHKCLHTEEVISGICWCQSWIQHENMPLFVLQAPTLPKKLKY